MACLENGNTFTWTFNVNNSGVIPATGVTGTVVLPVGVTYTSYTATKGTYNSGTGVWSIGSLASGDAATLVVTVTVSNSSLQPFTAAITVAGNEFEAYLLDNIASNVKGGGCGSCNDGFSCSDSTVGCLCGQVQVQTGACGVDSTIDYRIVEDSEVNCTVVIDPLTGHYTVTPTSFEDPWSFDWEVYCCCGEVCSGPLTTCTQSGTVPDFTEAFLNTVTAFNYVNDQTGGDVPEVYAAPITLPVQILENISVTEVFDNCIVFWTYTGGNWVEVSRFCDTVGAGGVLTSLAYNPTTHELLYTDENLAVTTLGLDVGVISYNNLTNILSYTAEDGTVTNISLNSVNVTNTIAGNRIATITNEAGAGVDIDETITTLVNNGNGTFTYTSEDGTVTVLDVNDDIATLTNLIMGRRIATYTNELGVTFDIDETITTLTNVVPGHRIGTYTNENGATVDIDEVITTITNTAANFTYNNENGDAVAVTYGKGSVDLCGCTPSISGGFLRAILHNNASNQLTLNVTNTVNSGNVDIDWGDNTVNLAVLNTTPTVNIYPAVGSDTWRIITITEPTGVALTKIYLIQKSDGTFQLANTTPVPATAVNGFVFNSIIGTLNDRYCPTSDVLDLENFGMLITYNNTANAITGNFIFDIENRSKGSYNTYLADGSVTVDLYNAWPYKDGTKSFTMAVSHTNGNKFVEIQGSLLVACAV